MGLKNYLMCESETKALAGKFEKLCKDIEGSLNDVEKFQELDSVIETGNINVLSQLNKVKLVLGDACKEISTLIAIVSVKEEEPETNETKMAEYLVKKESEEKSGKVLNESETIYDAETTNDVINVLSKLPQELKDKLNVMSVDEFHDFILASFPLEWYNENVRPWRYLNPSIDETNFTEILRIAIKNRKQ